MQLSKQIVGSAQASPRVPLRLAAAGYVRAALRAAGCVHTESLLLGLARAPRAHWHALAPQHNQPARKLWACSQG